MSHIEHLNHFKIPFQTIIDCTQNFNQTNFIGKVYKGILSWADHKNQQVAVKRLDNTSFQGNKEFYTEITMLSKYRHKNIIAFVGFCDQGKEMIVVYEYASHGSLDTYLNDAKMLDQLTWKTRLKICIGVASALDYLHNRVAPQHRVIHRDMKSANILLDEKWKPKLSDFGLSRIGLTNQQNTYLITNIAGTHGYCDPQYEKTGILTKESDVYSFGVVLFEVLCGRLVCAMEYHDERRFLHHLVRTYYERGELDKIVDYRIRDHIKDGIMTEFSAIAYQCLQKTREKRPSVGDLVLQLKKLKGTQARLKIKGIHEDIAALIECVSKNIGFSQGKPVAAVTIYKCLLHWKSFEAERTSVFDRLIQMFYSVTTENNEQLAYWLSNASTLMFLLQMSSIKSDGGSSVRKPSVFGIMAMKYRKSPYNARLVEAATGFEVVRQVEAKYPALLFKQQLTSYIEKMYGIIRDNLKNELGLFLTLCIQAPRATKGVLRSGQNLDKDSQSNHWQGIIDCLNTLLSTLKEYFVPPIIVRKIFTQIFSYMNAQLFNSLILRRECCTFNNGEYVKVGLAKLELWCAQANEEYAGFAWDELKHIRQAVGLLVIHQKHIISYDEIINNLCPILSVQQLHRICSIYRDDNYNVSPDVISSMRVSLTEDSNNAASNSFLLDANSSIPFSIDDLSSSLQVKDFTDVRPAVELLENPAFQFLHK